MTFFQRKHKSSTTLSEGALIKLKIIFRYFFFVLKGVVYWFIITKICFIEKCSLKLENHFSEIEPRSL